MVGLPSFFAALGCFGFSTAIHLSPKDAQKYHIASTLLYRKYGGPDAAPPARRPGKLGRSMLRPYKYKELRLVRACARRGDGRRSPKGDRLPLTGASRRRPLHMLGAGHDGVYRGEGVHAACRYLAGELRQQRLACTSAEEFIDHARLQHFYQALLPILEVF